MGYAYSLFNTHNNIIPLLFIIAYKLNEVLQYQFPKSIPLEVGARNSGSHQSFPIIQFSMRYKSRTSLCSPILKEVGLESQAGALIAATDSGSFDTQILMSNSRMLPLSSGSKIGVGSGAGALSRQTGRRFSRSTFCVAA